MNVQLIMLIIFSNDKSDHDSSDNSNSCSDESSRDTTSVSGSSSCVNSNDLKRLKTRKGYVPKFKKNQEGCNKVEGSIILGKKDLAQGKERKQKEVKRNTIWKNLRKLMKKLKG